MKHSVEILPQGRRLQAEGGASLLSVLMDNSILLRSDCGGKGVCGKCIVTVRDKDDRGKDAAACQVSLDRDLSIEIPSSSMFSSHIIKKPEALLPRSFVRSFADSAHKVTAYGLAVDIGTTTIALYLCNMTTGSVVSSGSVKNPQSIFGDDVMSRICEAAKDEENLRRLQQLVVAGIEWGGKELARKSKIQPEEIEKIAVVGNPTMIHLFLGENPGVIGVSPYQPAFFSSRQAVASQLGFESFTASAFTLPLVSGFIGADILAAAQAAEMELQPPGTLLIDIGTNGEILLKGKRCIYAASCATGPAFEGATISCGMQAVDGAVERVSLAASDANPELLIIKKDGTDRVHEPAGLCGSGIISAVAEFRRFAIIEPSGAFSTERPITRLSNTSHGSTYVLADRNNGNNERDLYISQKDIRSIQLGKSALATGIQLLLEKENLELPTKIIVAGGFGANINKNDMVTLGMIPPIDVEMIETAGNLAGAGAIMALCDQNNLEKAKEMSAAIKVVELASSKDFQKAFVANLEFAQIS